MGLIWTSMAWRTIPIAERITRDCFWRFLHFCNSDIPSQSTSASSATATSSAPSSSSPSDIQHPIDQLWKVRPVISAVVAACRINYRPHREQAIDEAMVAFKGRSCTKQYLPMVSEYVQTATMGVCMSSSATLERRETPLKVDWEDLLSLGSHGIWWGRYINSLGTHPVSK